MKDYKMTGQQAEERMLQYEKVFSVVRLLDAETILNAAKGKNQNISAEPCRCFDFWETGKRCSNCVFLKALEEKNKKTKLEFRENNVYQVTAHYVEVDGKPKVMELIQYLDEADIVDIDGSERLFTKLNGFQDELYRDVLTGIYNRRYYEDQLRKQILPAGIAMIDLDDFKLYNDTCGHNAGDLALTTVAGVIRGMIRRTTDILIRYGGDEFLLVMPGVKEEDFAQKLRQIQNEVHSKEVPGFSRLQLSVSIGGVLSEEHKIENAVEMADKLMYRAKNHKNTVVTAVNSQMAGPNGVFQEDSEKIRQQILIVDDSELNREILSEMLHTDFRILEAADGAQALEMLQQQGTGISLVLLDIIMPVLDGFGVLSYMAREHIIEDIPVIMISSDDSEKNIRRAYELGVSDYISRPFDAKVVYQRVFKTIKLYAKQRRLITLVTDQIYEKEKSSRMMVSILSQIVEFRNGESGLHVRHINILTEMLLDRLMQKTGRYHLNWNEQYLITLASSLHDIGKIGIDEKILNKPGRLTAEEFEEMKKHTVIGEEILCSLELYQNELLVKVAREICRWHHERYDGRGYPDGLKGEEIPISAQVVSLADVYDALVSDRVYKKAYSHEKAIQMILNGECGVFNPLLLECLLDIEDKIRIRILGGDVSTEISERGKKEQAAVLSEDSMESSGGAEASANL
ncbi:MAG: diguanylate cyclase [Lachnospiraceae bacterium]|nr:diguanylate cyclase [Lachnospiraceae bacterium]